MIFNPLFIDSDSGQLNLLTSNTKSSGSHLFQDIIKLEDQMLDRREFNTNGVLSTLLSEVKKMKAAGEYNAKASSSSLINTNADSVTTSELDSLENLSEEDIHNLLQKVFSDIELELDQPSTQDNVLENLNTDELVNEIEQKLLEQGDVKCLISNVDDKTNLLLTIQKAKPSEETDSEDGVILTKSTEQEETEENYVLKVLELGKDDDSSTDTGLDSGFLSSSQLLQFLNQSNDSVVGISAADINQIFKGDYSDSSLKVNTPKVESVIPTSVVVNEAGKAVITSEVNEAEKTVTASAVNEAEKTVTTAMEGSLGTSSEEQSNESGQKLQSVKYTAPSSQTVLSDLEVENNSLKMPGNEVEKTNTNNSEFDFLVKVAAKETSTISDENLLANMDIRSRVSTKGIQAADSIQIESENTTSEFTGKTDSFAANLSKTTGEAVSNTDSTTPKVSVDNSIEDSSAGDNLLKHFPDVNIEAGKKKSDSSTGLKESENKNLSSQNAGNENAPVKESSGTNSNNSSAQGETGRENSSSQNNAESGKELKTESTFKIEDQSSSILQNSDLTKSTSARVVRVDTQNLTNLHLANELSDEISEMVFSKNKDQATIVLEPQELGKIKVSIEVTDKHVHASVEVESNTVKEILQSNSDNLKQNLSNSGLQLGSLNISLQQNTEKGNGQTSAKQAKRDEKVAEVKDENGSTEVENSKSMGYNTYEYII